MPAKSFAVSVLPAQLTDDEETQLFEAIFELTPLGGQSVGFESRVFSGWPTSFYYATEDEIDIAIELEIDTGLFVAADVLADAKKRIEDWVATLNIGATIRRIDIQRELASVPGVLGVMALTINTSATDYVLSGRQFATATVTATEA